MHRHSVSNRIYTLGCSLLMRSSIILFYNQKYVGRAMSVNTSKSQSVSICRVVTTINENTNIIQSVMHPDTEQTIVPNRNI
jgi:hypothetical protein